MSIKPSNQLINKLSNWQIIKLPNYQIIKLISHSPISSSPNLQSHAFRYDMKNELMGRFQRNLSQSGSLFHDTRQTHRGEQIFLRVGVFL
jgi:hypothetical protein